MRNASPAAIAAAAYLSMSMVFAASAGMVAAKPRPAPVKPVTETLWGKKVTDNYRYMEALDPSTLSWMKAEGRYTRSILDSIKPLAELKTRVANLTASLGLVQGYASFGGRAFYDARTPGSDNFDLMVKDAKGVRKIVDMAALRAAHGGKPFAINYFLPSPDGEKVAVGISEAGSEDASLTVYDAASGRQMAGPIDRADFGATAWTDDSKTLYFSRRKKLASTDAPTEKYKDSTIDAWDLKSDPVPVLGATLSHGPAIGHAEFPTITMSVGAPIATATSNNGTQNEVAMWTVPVAQANDPKAVWTKLVTRDDDVTGMDERVDELFLLSHKNAPTFKILTLKVGQPLSAATVLVPAKPDRVIEGMSAASDALYVFARHGVYSQLLRVPAGSTKIEDVRLPFAGHVGDVFADPRVPGVTISLSSWAVPPTEYSWDPATEKFTDLGIGTHGDMDSANYVVRDLEATAHDGTMVPLTLVQKKNAKGPQITLIEAYGSYGSAYLADFIPRRAPAMREGITRGICHVRGGGELGEAWRLAGKDANKHNTWEDLIACGEYAVSNGITTKKKLFIFGRSAGGITMGRALTTRPDLFAGVLDLVPAANTLRGEFSPNGPPNIPEFGTVKAKAGFENLFAMDTIQHVEKGVQYPAVMVSTGLNDPRVSPWEPAKAFAAIEASGTKKPVLLRVDEEAGHGVGETKTQSDRLEADCIAFIFWQAGLPQWQPAAANPRRAER